MSRVERIIRVIFVLFMAAILGAIVYGHGGQSSEVSNWIIAGANVVMAIAAVKAFKAAPKYLNEFIAKEGYRHAAEIINDNIIHLGVNNECMAKCHDVVIVYSKINDEPPTKVKGIRFANALEEFKEEIVRQKTYLKNITDLSFKIEIYGIYAAEHKKKYWIDMALKLQNMITIAEGIIADLSGESARYIQSAGDAVKMFHPFNSHLKVPVQERFEQFSEEWNGMLHSRTAFLSGDKHVRSLFVVRDS